jgi:GntR family transcriptional regulator, arabinose operon transcriptional repressor
MILHHASHLETPARRRLYHTVKEAVRAAIDAGTFAPGHRLPSTKALSEQLSVSLVTVHRALQELVASGVLRRGQGRGTFVHEDYQDRAETSTGMRFGLVFHRESSLADYYHGQILEGVRQGADEFGVDLVLLRFGEDWRNECQGYLARRGSVRGAAAARVGRRRRR